MERLGVGSGLFFYGLATTFGLSLALSGCGDSDHDEPAAHQGGEGGSAGGGTGGSAGVDGGVGGDAGRGGAGGSAGMSGSSGSSPTGGAAGTGGVGGTASAGEGGEQGGSGGGGGAGDGLAPSSEVAKSCATPLTSSLLPDNTFGWNTAALRIDAVAPSCSLQAGMGIGSGGNALYFAHESNDSYSLWTDFPWSFSLDSGQTANNLPQDQPLTVYPYLESVRLRVVFTLNGESVTVNTVEAE